MLSYYSENNSQVQESIYLKALNSAKLIQENKKEGIL